ncbi:response regulator [Pedobacter hiemivivus]|uniref:histidine kinase n=1 Tax=Pedobacter hiemivivus TaxID=2530454 RepID=A0A4U1GDI6_9SPHI|nr:ATP-binding protein [Pedobacter hiemivivus]TKC62121.1 response regulator [Pedobacter hiemivivus]
MSFTIDNFDLSVFFKEIPCVVFRIHEDEGRFSFSFVSAAIERELELNPILLINDIEILLDLLSQKHRESFLSSLESAVRRSIPWKWEGYFNLPSGKKKWIQGLGEISRSSKTTIDCFFKDITAEKHIFDMFTETSKLTKTGSWELDLLTNHLFWSDEVYVIHEVEPKIVPELDHALSFYSAEGREMIINLIGNAVKSGESWDVEVSFVTARGNDRWVRTSGKVVFENGIAVKLHGIIQDITEKRLSEEIFSVIFKYSTDAHFLFGIKGIIDCNDAAIAMLNCSNKAELLACHPADFSPKYQPDGRLSSEKSLEMDNLAYKNGYNQFEWLHKRVNGETFTVLVTLKPVNINSKTVLLTVWHDITEQKYRTELIKLNQILLSETQELTHSGSWEADLVTGKNYWSDEAFRIFGLIPEKEGPNTLSFGRMIHPDDKETYKRVVQNTIDDRVMSDFNLRIILSDGQIRYIRAIGKPLINESGEVTKLYGAIVDITAQKNAENELIMAKDLAEQAATAKSQFLATMSHEIRTPMNAVIGFTNLLLLKDPNPEQLEYLKVLKFSGDNLLVLINDILDFSKMEEGRVTFEMIDFSIPELLKNIRLSLLEKAKEKGLELKLSIDEELSEAVMGDPVRLGQILTNLINNAIKFTSKGKVSISAFFVSRNKVQTIIDFEVTDTGIGIPKDKMEFIFERFTQANADTNRKYGGTGLGLAITKRLIELQGGNIQVESTPEVGSSFKFGLSFRNGSNESIMAGESIPVKALKNLKGIKVLMAEDNEINVILVKQFMKFWQVECDVVGNGLLALQQVQLRDYDMVFMDLQMPIMDGYQSATAIRALSGDKFKRLPIIALTASAMLDVQYKAFDSGMNDYISKPFKPEELYHKIEIYGYEPK